MTIRNTTAEILPVQESSSSRPTARPAHTRRTPQSRMPGEPSNPRPRPHRLLGHALTSPQKRTLKRIEALRTGLFGGGFIADEVRARVMALLFEDRELRAAVSRNALEELADMLMNAELRRQTTADLVGAFLRDLGAMQRPELSGPRVKAALRSLNEVLFGEQQSGVIASGVREFKLEKRDGGMQIVAVLRKTASFDAVREGVRQVLREQKLIDIDVRIEK